MSEIIKVEFYGQEIEAIQQGADIWISVKRVCENLGIGNNHQNKKILANEAFEGLNAVIGIETQYGKRETFCIHIEALTLWLATIQANRVRKDVRPMLVKYQRECMKALNDHFMGITSPQSSPSSPVPTPNAISDLRDELQIVCRTAELLGQDAAEALKRYCQNHNLSQLLSLVPASGQDVIRAQIFQQIAQGGSFHPPVLSSTANETHPANPTNPTPSNDPITTYLNTIYRGMNYMGLEDCSVINRLHIGLSRDGETIYLWHPGAHKALRQYRFVVHDKPKLNRAFRAATYTGKTPRKLGGRKEPSRDCVSLLVEHEDAPAILQQIREKLMEEDWDIKKDNPPPASPPPASRNREREVTVTGPPPSKKATKALPVSTKTSLEAKEVVGRWLKDRVLRSDHRSDHARGEGFYLLQSAMYADYQKWFAAEKIRWVYFVWKYGKMELSEAEFVRALGMNGLKTPAEKNPGVWVGLQWHWDKIRFEEKLPGAGGMLYEEHFGKMAA